MPADILKRGGGETATGGERGSLWIATFSKGKRGCLLACSQAFEATPKLLSRGSDYIFVMEEEGRSRGAGKGRNLLVTFALSLRHILKSPSVPI